MHATAEDVILQVSKYAMHEDEFSQPRKEAYEKRVPPSPADLQTERPFDTFRFGHELPRSHVARGSGDTLGKPAFNAPDQGGNFGRESALLRATLGDSVLDRAAQGQQPG